MEGHTHEAIHREGHRQGRTSSQSDIHREEHIYTERHTHEGTYT